MNEEMNNSYNYGSSSSTNTNTNPTTNATDYGTQNATQTQHYGAQEFYYTAGSQNTNFAGSAPVNHKKVKKQKNTTGFARRAAACIALGLVFGLAAGCAFSVPTYLTNKANAELAQKTAQIQQSTAQKSALDTTTSGLASASATAATPATSADVTAIANNCLPSVVSITNKGVSEVRTMFGNYQQEYQSSGSGIIIGKNDTELLIVTNNHVVSGSNELSVVFSYDEDSDEPTVVGAKLKGYDSEKDLAVIAVALSDLSEDTLSKVKIATIGDSSNLQLGQEVVAIGNALGYGQSVTTGIISALNREVSVQAENGTTITNKLIQTDAAINPGNSGGALLNMKGELIGINSVKVASSQVEGMGYAIPITDVQDIINNLMLKETRDVVGEDEQGYIGIGGTDVTSEISSTYDLPIGVYVNNVYDNSPAAEAGIQKGYIITKFDGSTIASMAELKEMLSYYKAGETVDIVCEVQGANGYEEQTLNIKLGTKDAIEKAASNDEKSQDSDAKEKQSEEQPQPVNPLPEQDGQNNESEGNNFFWPFGNQW